MTTALKVGVLGAGGISRLHVPHWLTLGAVVRSHSLVGAERLAGEYGIDVIERMEDLIDWADVVDICTPTTTHASLALAAIVAGKNVLCEKPLGRTAAEAQKIAAAAHAGNVQVYPAHVVRFFPEYVALRNAVSSGRIGKPAILRFSRGGAGATSDWFFDDALSGGIILDQIIHDIDQARWIAGEVVDVYATQNPPTVGGVVPRIVAAHVTLTHVGGAISHIHGVWGPPGMEFRTSFSVAGADGILQYASAHAGSIDENLATKHTDASYLPPETAEESPYLTEIREFAAAFQGGPPPRVRLEDGVLAVAIAEAARMSIQTGRAQRFNATDFLERSHR